MLNRINDGQKPQDGILSEDHLSSKGPNGVRQAMEDFVLQGTTTRGGGPGNLMEGEMSR